jgi:hypothetical protein
MANDPLPSLPMGRREVMARMTGFTAAMGGLAGCGGSEPTEASRHVPVGEPDRSAAHDDPRAPSQPPKRIPTH